MRMEDKIKILTICEHGNIRSVAMAYLIKTIYQHKHEVLSCGIKDISKKTFWQLCSWADKVVFMDKKLVPSVIEYDDKNHMPEIIIANLGKDIWHDAQAQELVHKCLKQLHKLNL